MVACGAAGAVGATFNAPIAGVMFALEVVLGLDMGRRNPPDVLIADWMLTDDLCGLEIAELLRGSNPTMKAINISGYPSSE